MDLLANMVLVRLSLSHDQSGVKIERLKQSARFIRACAIYSQVSSWVIIGTMFSARH